MNCNIKLLISYVSRYKWQLLVVFCSLLVVALTLLQVGLIFRNLIDIGLGDNEPEHIRDSVILILFLIIIFAVGSFFRSYFINLIAEKVTTQIKIDTYANLLRLEIAAFEELKIGDVISRISSDLNLVSNLITNFLSFFIRNSIMLIGGIILMFLQSPKLSSLVIFSIPVMLIPLLRLSKYVRLVSRKVMTENANLSVFIEETLYGIRTVYAFNQQAHTLERFKNKASHYLQESNKRLKMRSIFFSLAITMVASSITVVIWVGSLDITAGDLSAGQMISFIYYAIVVGMSAGGIAEVFSEIGGPMAALERVSELRSYYQKLQQEDDPDILVRHNISANTDSTIAFEDISFAYPSRAGIVILDKMNFAIKTGRFIGIVGKSGTGKSTIMQLLLGFYKPAFGVIQGLAGLKMAYAPQGPSIFSGTLHYNISFSNPEASDQEVEEVVKLCGIDKIAHDLEYGLDTEIGEKGIRLSGGQKQRIAIARALLYKPDILLLDEATSALDNESEKELLAAVRNFMKSKTIISIAHRISSIEAADEILVLDHGKVIAFGTHQELIKTCRLYSSIQEE